MAARRDRVDVADLKRGVLLSDLARRRVTLVKRGSAWWGCCPFHKEKSPSFEVRDILGTYHCFGCGAHGDAVSWLMQIDGLTFHEAVARLGGTAEPDVVRQHRVHQERQDTAKTASMGHWSSARVLDGSMVGDWLRYAYGVAGPLSEAVRWREDDWYAGSVPPLVARIEDGNGMCGVYDRPRDEVIGTLGLGCVRLSPARPLLALAVSLIGAMWIQGYFGVPCWASLVPSRLGKIVLPDDVSELVIFADDDEWGDACRAADRHDSPSRAITLERLGDRLHGQQHSELSTT